MFELSEKNLILIVIALSAFLILLLAKRPAYNTCVRERLDTDYHTMFDKSNNILCPSEEGSILTKEEITNPKSEIENVVHDHDHDHEHEHEKVLNEEQIVEEEPTLKEIITSVADMEESTSNLIDDSQEIKEEVKKISEEVKKISEEVVKVQSETKPVTEEVIKSITEEVIKVSEEVKSVAEEVKKMEVEPSVEVEVAEPEKNSLLKNMVVKIAGEVKKVAGEVKKIKEEQQVIDEEQEIEVKEVDETETIKKVAEEIKKIMSSKVKSEASADETKSVDIVGNIPAPYSGSMLGYSIGGIDTDNDLVTDVTTKVNPRCDVYKDAVKKLNLTGYIKNDDLNQSWNDSFGNSCGKI